eukprot:3215791-Pleurochrysis_carterae.AAC.1
MKFAGCKLVVSTIERIPLKAVAFDAVGICGSEGYRRIVAVPDKTAQGAGTFSSQFSAERCFLFRSLSFLSAWPG